MKPSFALLQDRLRKCFLPTWSNQEVSSESKEQLGKAIYFVLLTLGFAFIVDMNSSFQNSHWPSKLVNPSWTHQWLNNREITNIFLKVLGPCCLALYLIFAIFTQRPWARFSCFLILTIVIATDFNNTQTHSTHFLLWATLPFVLGLRGDTWAKALDFSQAQVILIYALAGAQKFQNMVTAGAKSAPVGQYLEYSIAQEYLNSNKIGFLGGFVIDYPYVSLLLSVGVVLFQCSAFFIFFFVKLRFLFGVMAILFHLMNGLLLQIHFNLALIVVFVLFVLPRVILSIVGDSPVKTSGLND
jgi:hypothetical protein